MSTAAVPEIPMMPPPSVSAAPVANPGSQVKSRLSVFIDEDVVIPDWVVDHDSFRQWAHSDDFPSSGRYSFIDGMIWVELTMEEFFGHNQVKQAFNTTLGSLVQILKNGYYVPDGSLWTHIGAGISTEPDALFFTFDALKVGRIRLIKGAQHGYMELEGTPDMALEIVSDSSVKKDTMILKDACAKAGVAEYWLVDARGMTASFQNWCLRDGAYQPAPNSDGWLTSPVFGKSFKLEQSVDPLGHPAFQLLVR